MKYVEGPGKTEFQMWRIIMQICAFKEWMSPLSPLFLGGTVFQLWTNFSDANSILDIIGSTGNSAILRPSWNNSQKVSSCWQACINTFVSSPIWLSAPRAYNCSRAKISVSGGGGSMKSKWIRSFIPKLFKSSTTLPRLVRWIYRAERTDGICIMHVYRMISVQLPQE